MKIIYLYFVLWIVLLLGCSEEKPEMFIDTRFIQFKFDNISGDPYYQFDFSFAYTSDDTESKVMAIPVVFKGYNLNSGEKLHFAVEVDKEKTTLPGECYLLDREQPFQPESGNVDTMRVTLLRKAILKDGSKTLRLQLVANSDFETFIPDSTFVEIHVGDVFIRPEWWNSAVENSYLGTYSKLKYDEFMKETGAYNFGEMDPSEKRYYAILFKRALEANPRRDEDGSVMSVTVTG